MPKMTTDTTPEKLEMWLNITIAQRERQLKALSKQFGNNSAATHAIKQEIMEISAAIASSKPEK